jgi:hypothetical protein
MKRIGKLTWWNHTRGFGICESKNADYSLQRFYVHVAKITRCVPDTPKINCWLRFDVSPELPKRSQDVPAALNVEVFETQEQLNAALAETVVLEAL